MMDVAQIELLMAKSGKSRSEIEELFGTPETPTATVEMPPVVVAKKKEVNTAAMVQELGALVEFLRLPITEGTVGMYNIVYTVAFDMLCELSPTLRGSLNAAPKTEGETKSEPVIAGPVARKRGRPRKQRVGEAVAGATA